MYWFCISGKMARTCSCQVVWGKQHDLIDVLSKVCHTSARCDVTGGTLHNAVNDQSWEQIEFGHYQVQYSLLTPQRERTHLHASRTDFVLSLSRSISSWRLALLSRLWTLFAWDAEADISRAVILVSSPFVLFGVETWARVETRWRFSGCRRIRLKFWRRISRGSANTPTTPRWCWSQRSVDSAKRRQRWVYQEILIYSAIGRRDATNQNAWETRHVDWPFGSVAVCRFFLIGRMGALAFCFVAFNTQNLSIYFLILLIQYF